VPRSPPAICRGKRRSRSGWRWARPGGHEFTANQPRFETGKLYKLILRNDSIDPHYFTSHAFSACGRALREIEVYPGHAAEWWLVPVAAGRATDLRCDIKPPTARPTPTSA
jgi:hypothetical protein